MLKDAHLAVHSVVKWVEMLGLKMVGMWDPQMVDYLVSQVAA